MIEMIFYGYFCFVFMQCLSGIIIIPGTVSGTKYVKYKTSAFNSSFNEFWVEVVPETVNVAEGRVPKECMKFLFAFSNATSDFIDCAVTNARPLHYCQKCAEKYVKVQEIYKLIFKDVSEGGMKGCKELILRADNIQVVLMTYDFVTSIWSKSTCDNCFNVSYKNHTKVYNVTKEAKLLLKKINNTMDCFRDFASGIFPSNQTSDSNSTVCTMCINLYCDANDLYDQIERDKLLCSDLIDSMNYTRLDWGKKYNCTIAVIDKGEVWIITAIVCFLPIMFYVGAWLCKTKCLCHSQVVETES
ncbi:osteopetrosis-associated transmembrane protein 1-like [Clavelina lepadiformis]|uniref:osteopetrosis-associated transmembrane protein 1-like n=1 Tax=Clavelina lepadiformis TaxID=159417 RepID=UPI004040ECCA